MTNGATIFGRALSLIIIPSFESFNCGFISFTMGSSSRTLLPPFKSKVLTSVLNVCPNNTIAPAGGMRVVSLSRGGPSIFSSSKRESSAAMSASRRRSISFLKNSICLLLEGEVSYLVIASCKLLGARNPLAARKQKRNTTDIPFNDMMD